MKVDKAIEAGFIPDYYRKFIPTKCSCGGDIEVNRDLTSIWCSNLRCPTKLANQCYNMFKKLGVAGVGVSTFEKIFQDPKLRTPLYPFIYEHWSTSVVISLREALDRKYTYRDVIRILSFPGMDKTALKIFNEVQSPDTIKNLMSKMNYKITDWLLPLVGAKTYDKLYPIFKEFEFEILNCNCIFKLKPQVKNVIDIVVTGTPRGFKTKRDFIEKLDSIAEGYAEFNMCSKLESAPYIVADTNTPTEKFKAGVRRGVLVRSWELIKGIQKGIEEERREEKCQEVNQI